MGKAGWQYKVKKEQHPLMYLVIAIKRGGKPKHTTPALPPQSYLTHTQQ